MKKLAICIPNYNKQEWFARLISQSVEQVKHSGFTDDVEICISDDASQYNITDDVNTIINENHEVSIKYQRTEVNKGRWGNIKEVIDMSSAEFCWVIGNDDIYAQEDAIDVVVKKLCDKVFDIMTFPGMSFNGEKYEKDNQLFPETTSRLFNLTIGDDFDKWFGEPLSQYNFFSDSMLVVFRKTLWNKFVNEVQLDDDGFGFWIVMGIIALKGGTLYYYNNHLIVRNNKDKQTRWKSGRFCFLYLRDILEYIKKLKTINIKAAELLDRCRSVWYVYYYGVIIESNEVTASQQRYIKIHTSERLKLIDRLYFPSSRLAELKGKPIFIFGTGDIGNKVRSKLDSLEIAMDFYIDNDIKKQGEFIDGIEVISLQESLRTPNGIYIISAAKNDAITSIYKQLINIGVTTDRTIMIRI